MGYINEEPSRVNTFINKYNNGISKSFIEEDRRIYRNISTEFRLL